jgi:hypothetical protein
MVECQSDVLFLECLGTEKVIYGVLFIAQRGHISVDPSF